MDSQRKASNFLTKLLEKSFSGPYLSTLSKSVRKDKVQKVTFSKHCVKKSLSTPNEQKKSKYKIRFGY